MNLPHPGTHSDLEQSRVRVCISFLVLGYTVYLLLAGGMKEPAFLGTLYVASALLLHGHLKTRPEVLPWRRVAGMLLDMSALTIGMIIGGESLALLYPFFLWIVIGMGLRFGPKYLLVAAGLSVVGFGLTIALSEFWQAHLTLSAGLLLALIMLPGYGLWLLPKLTFNPIEHAEETENTAPNTDVNPPKGAEVLMDFFLEPARRNEIMGDLGEQFRNEIVPKYGPEKAKRWYWWQAIREVSHSLQLFRIMMYFLIFLMTVVILGTDTVARLAWEWVFK